MTSGFDELVEELLYDVALAGNVGIGSEELESAVKTFYGKLKAPQQVSCTNDEDILFSSAPPTTSTTVVDDPLLDAVWFWLKQHPDIEITDGRIFTNEERIWQVIAGHGVDHSRIPPKMFECLTVIAAHGPSGVLQPDVRRITGQAKQSVPHRTDVLAQRGYITKEQVVAKTTNTTLLTLRRFAKDVIPGPQHVQAYSTSKRFVGDESVWHYDAWFDKTIELIQANENIIVVTDLLIGLGIYDDRKQTRAFRRCYNRAVESGWLRRVSAPVEGGRDGDGTEEDYVLRCLQLVREATDLDRAWFKKSSGPDKISRRLANGELLDDQADELERDDGIFGSDIDELDDNPLPEHRVHPQWTPDLCYNNFVYNIIDNAGPTGISSMALNEIAGGHFWRRPLDEMMLRLTDVWQHSQPAHLKHLSIVRDTGAHGKLAHFHFRTLPNFKKAVEQGHTSWKAVKSNSVKAKRGRSRKDVVVDEWGFPELKAHLFEGDGTASLLQCQASARSSLGDVDAVDGETPKKRPGKKRKLVGPTPQTPMRLTTAIPSPSTFNTAVSSSKAVVVNAAASQATTPSIAKRPNVANETVGEFDGEMNLNPMSQNDIAAMTSSGKRKRKPTAEVDVLGRNNATSVSKTPATCTELLVNPPGSYPPHLIKPGRRKGALVAVIRSPSLRRVSSFNSNDLDDDEHEPVEEPRSVPRPVEACIVFSKETRAPQISQRGPSTITAEVENTSVQEDATLSQVSQSGISVGSAHNQLQWFQMDPAQKSYNRPRKGRIAEIESNHGTPARLSLQVSRKERFPGVCLTQEGSPLSSSRRAQREKGVEVMSIREVPVLSSKQQPQKKKSGKVMPLRETQAPLLNQPMHDNNDAETTGERGNFELPSNKRPRDDSNVDVDNDAFRQAVPEGRRPKRTKRGRPSNAELAERERMLQAITAAPTVSRRPSLVAKLPVVVPEVQQAKRSLIVRLSFKTQIGLREVHRITAETSERPARITISSGLSDPSASKPSHTQMVSSTEMTNSHDPSNIWNGGETNLLASVIQTSGAPNGTDDAAAAAPITSDELLPPSTEVPPLADSLESSNVKSPTGNDAPGFVDKLPLSPGRDFDQNAIAPGEHGSRGSVDVSSVSPPPADSEQKPKPGPSSAPMKRGGRLARFDTPKGSLAENDADRQDLPAIFTVDVSGPLSTTARKYIKPGTVRNSGIMQVRRQEIVLNIVRKGGGVFPGDNDMWHTFSMQWQALHSQNPEKETVERAITSLVEMGKLRKLGFVFSNFSGVQIQRHIIVDPRHAKAMEDARVVQKEIIDLYPYRLLPRTIQLMKRLTQQANESKRVAGRGHILEDSDEEYTPDQPTEEKSPFANPTMYYAEFPTISGVTVKRTAQAIAVAEADTPLVDTPRNLRAVRPRRIFLPVDEQFHDSDNSDEYEDDENTPVHPAQAAAMSSFSVQRYIHDATATPAKFARPRPRKSMQDSRKNTALMNSFGRPSDQLSDGSDSDSDQDDATVRRVLNTRKFDSAADWQQLSSTPNDLNEVLKRARTLGNSLACSSDSLFWQFQCEVDNVMAFEVALQNAGRELGTPAVRGFVNHGLNQPQILPSAGDAAQDISIEFVEGFLAVGKAEKLRANVRGRQTKRKRLMTLKTARTPYNSSISNVSKYPTTQVPGHPLSLDLPRSGASIVSHRQQTSTSSAQVPASWSPLVRNPISRPSIVSTPVVQGPSTHLTPYNTRYKGEGRPRLNWSDDFTEFEVIPRAPVELKVAQNRKNAVTQADKERLVVALALHNLLCCGAHGEPRTKWEIISHAFAFTQEANNLRQRWKGQSRTEFGNKYLAVLEEAIREPFLEAYKMGELPTVDFSQINKTDWPALVRWVEAKILPLSQSARTDSLPIDREAFEGEFEISVEEREATSTEQDDNSRRILPASISKSTKTAESKLDLNAVLEKSWVRALVSTKDEIYDEDKATQKLSVVNEDRLATILKEMVESKTIMHVNKGRQQAGRNYVLSKHMISQFNRWPGDAGSSSFLSRLASAWKGFAEHFQYHDKLELDPNATEAETMVLNNLVANGRIRIKPILPSFNDDFNAPAGTLSKWGMGGYSHNPKQVDESLFKLGVVYERTASFSLHHGLQSNVERPTSPQAVPGESGARIPFWMDIHGNWITEIWGMVLRSMLHLLLYRPGCTARTIEKAHNNKLWAWEIELVLAWMENVGIAEKCGGSGWRASEWWFCAFMPEIAGLC